MKKKIFIFGHSGYIGSYLLKFLDNKDYDVFGYKIPRPDGNDLDNFYKNFIENFLSTNKNIFCIINSAGSINCETKEEYFFNSRFDVIFQKLINEKKLNLKYLSFNSTKVFTNSLDNYALSKKELNNHFDKRNQFYTLYIDLVFQENSPHFKTIKNKIENMKLFFIPVFFPGKNFYPIDLDKFANTIKEIIIKNFKVNKFIIIGDKKIYFHELIEHVNKVSNINRKILYIPSKLINYFPLFIKKILLKSKSFQQYENHDWLKDIDTKKFLIRKQNNKF